MENTVEVIRDGRIIVRCIKIILFCFRHQMHEAGTQGEKVGGQEVLNLSAPVTIDGSKGERMTNTVWPIDCLSLSVGMVLWVMSLLVIL